jgi:hypothetical protein
MKLFHITKQGNLHFQLKDGRLAAIYPETGYVRVSHSLSNFTNPAYAERARVRYDNAVRLKNPGNIRMWPINKRIKTKTLQPVHTDLYYKIRWSDNKSFEMFKYPNKVFFEMESSVCERYPNDIEKLYELLAKFELNNCTMTADKNWQY